MQIDNKKFIQVIKQQTNLTMEELERRFKGRPARTRGLGSRPQVVEDVSINRHHGVIFRLTNIEPWLAPEQVVFLDEGVQNGQT